ncbi:conserved hypothetical protein [Gammaproteobacteria bacterium]
MIKFTSNNDFDFGVESVSLIRDVSKDLTKRASAKDLLKYEKTPNQEDLHIIALGAYEGTGRNRNNDQFREKYCRENHHTFTKANRAVHRHHKNKPTDPKYGNIKASAYNEAMKRVELVIGLDKDAAADILEEQERTGNTNYSMACFPAGIKVKMADDSEKNIEDVVVGEQVVTHKGNIKTVTNTMNRPYSDISVNFRPAKACDPVICTKDHLIFVRPAFDNKFACPVCGEKFKNLKAHLWQKQDQQHQYVKNNLHSQFDTWKQAQDINIGDFVATPFSKEVKEEGDPNYAALLGWYLAEGHVYESKNVRKSSHCLDFTLNIAEEHYATEITNLLIKLGVKEIDIRKYQYPKTHKLVIRCRDLVIAEKLKEDGGKYSYGKKLSSKIKTWSPKVQKLILEKWIEGDGTLGKTRNALSGVSVSRQLVHDLCTIAYRNNIIPSITNYKGKNRVRYTLSFNNSDTGALNVIKKGENWKPAENIRTYDLSGLQPWQKGQVLTQKRVSNPLRYCYIEGSFVYRKVYKLKQEFLDTQVYDLTVEDDHSFIASNIGVHNCKIPHDCCTWCGHKAKTDKDRCEHIPKNLGEIDKDGRACAMDNIDPKWFEISYVRRPADRIGMSLSKLASDSSIKPMLPTDYLKLYGDIYVPEDVYLSKKASDKRELLKKLSELEKHVEAVARGKKDTSKELFLQRHGAKIKTDPIDAKTMDDLRKLEPGQVLKALADNGIIFSPEDFTKYLFDNRVGKDRVEGMKTHLPDIFSKLMDDGSVTNDEKFEPSGLIPPFLKKLMNSLKEGHSLEGGPGIRRIMSITISCGPKELKKTEEKSKEACDFELAKQYCNYKLAALNYIDEQGKLDEDILTNSVLQNRV